MLLRKKLVAIGAAVALGSGLGYQALSGGDYQVQFVIPSAANLVGGSPVWVDGTDAGHVERLEVRDGKAVAYVSIDDEYAPLHGGTKSFVEWNSALGERIFTVYPGPAKNPVIPDGGLLKGQSRQVEVDEVLAALDAKTRERLTSLLGQLNGTISGQETDLRSTLRSAGPAVNALGHVLEAVGQDGPAIRTLVNQVREVTKVVSTRRSDVAGTVQRMTDLTDRVATQEGNLSEGLRELPATLRTAKATLDRVPEAGQATVPLLEDLRPATERLPSVAANLQPVLRDLRPAVGKLRPTLAQADRLLGETPGMLDSAHQVLPQVTRAVGAYQPAVSFLRPYTPELVGWFHNWGQTFAPYDSQGHVWAAVLAPGSNAVNESVVQPPGSVTSPRPYPGEVVGQPWTDAHGSGMR